MAGNRHPGISMHKLPVGGGFIGILFAIGSSVIFILGFPTLWYFVVLTFGLGVAIAIFLRAASRYRSGRNKPLSILQPAISQPPAKSEPTRKLLSPKPRLAF
jgi:hypothetical protein